MPSKIKTRGQAVLTVHSISGTLKQTRYSVMGGVRGRWCWWQQCDIGIKTRRSRDLYWGNQDNGQKLFQSRTWFVIQESDQREKKRKSSNTYNLSLYTLCLPLSNHSSCSDVPSKYPTMTLHTTYITVIYTIMPQGPTSQHLRKLPYHNTLYHHHFTIIAHDLRVYQCLSLSVVPFPPTPDTTSRYP